ncbi:UNVERIFIED_CONTAM: Plant UBX domain-containing protein 8, partial [Sesamum angustifolium]
EHHGNLNEAVDAHFSEHDGNRIQAAPLTSPQDYVMDVDDPIPFTSHRPLSSLFPFATGLNPFSQLNPNFTRSLFDRSNAAARSPFISHAREVREIPIEVKDEIGVSSHPGGAPTIEDVTETAHVHGPEVRGIVIIDEEDDDDEPQVTHADGLGTQDSSTNSGPGRPTIMDVPDYENDIEDEMLRAAIEASKQDTAMSNQQSDETSLLFVTIDKDLRDSTLQPEQFYLEDASLAHAVSLSLQTAERGKVVRELEGKIGASEVEGLKSAAPERMEKLPSNGWPSWVEVGNTSLEDEAEDVEELPLVRHRRRCVSTGPTSTAKNIEDIDVTPPSSPRCHDCIQHLQHDGSDFPSDAVRPYPRHAFSDGESTSTLHELGLTSKQEALYLELI